MFSREPVSAVLLVSFHLFIVMGATSENPDMIIQYYDWWLDGRSLEDPRNQWANAVDRFAVGVEAPGSKCRTAATKQDSSLIWCCLENWEWEQSFCRAAHSRDAAIFFGVHPLQWDCMTEGWKEVIGEEKQEGGGRNRDVTWQPESTFAPLGCTSLA